MSLAALAVENKTVTSFATALLVVGGMLAYGSLGQLEDPEFTVKSAAITTSYPGASPEEVELEVTDRIELSIQEMSQLKNVYSSSRAGLSIIKVDIKDQYPKNEIPQVWDELRRKVGDVEGELPPGAGTPVVSDDFGDVFGFVIGITGDGFTYAEIETAAKAIKKELSLVEGVARVEFWGVQQRCIYVVSTQQQLTTLGLSPADVVQTLSAQNTVVDAGGVDVADKRLRIALTGAFDSPQDIEDLAVRGSDAGTGELITIGDIAEVRQGYIDPPSRILRCNGLPAVGLFFSNVPGANIVDVGNRVQARLDEFLPALPVGLEVERIAWQADEVSKSIDSFIVNLVEAIAIVLIVLWVSMGLRMAAIIGIGGLLFVILGTLLVMAVWGIDLQRMSLGALVISMGMMVDNAIVVADGFVVRLQQGMDRKQAAIESGTLPATPLLGATVVAVMAFFPIFASPMSTGEYCASLFQVVAISLILSWVLSVTIVPLMCMQFLPAPKKDGGADPYRTPFFRAFRRVLAGVIRVRYLFLVAMVALLVAAALGFGRVEQMFFPDSSRPQLMVDVWNQEGTRIEQTSADLQRLEEWLLDDERVTGVATFVGGGPPRFYLPVTPEDGYSSYGEIIVTFDDFRDIDDLIRDFEPWAAEALPGAMVRTRKYTVGPGETWAVEARFSGPAVADPDVLRGLAWQGMEVLRASPMARDVRSNWRTPVLRVTGDYHQEQGRWTGVTREDVARGLRASYDGNPVGIYREGDEILPIIGRFHEEERQTRAGALGGVQVSGWALPYSVPLAQLTRSILPEWEDPLIWRWNRRRAVTVACAPDGVQAPTLQADIFDDFDAIELPPGYSLEWDGLHDAQKTSSEGLVPGIAPALAIMALIIVGLFNAFRQPLIIALVIPFAAIGITVGLLVTGTPFGFMALLGAMSLAGMMIKNAIVLLDQVEVEIASGKPAYDAVMDSAVSRLRPVLNAAATTILGMAPLLQDVFWVSMSVTIMFGLAFGTVLTMVVIPVLYTIFFRVRREAAAA